MSIATVLTQLATAKDNIATAITEKGGTVGENDGFLDFAADIATISTSSGNIGGQSEDEPVILNLQTLNVTQNGVYNAEELSVDGWDQVNVSVSSGSGNSATMEMSPTSLPEGITSIDGYYTSPTSTTGYSMFATSYGRFSSLPSTLTTLGRFAFKGLTNLTVSSLPNGLTTIGDYAFSGCSGLTVSTIPASVISIGKNAFASCSGLTSITFADSATPISIAVGVFGTNANITQITIGRDITIVGSASSVPLLGILHNLTTVIFTNYVTTIPDSVCKDADSLNSVTIPNTVTAIGSRAFEGATALTTLTFPGNITSIDTLAFSGCSSLATIVFPNATSVPTLAGTNAFEGLDENYEIQVPAALLDDWKATTKWKDSTIKDHIVAISE